MKKILSAVAAGALLSVGGFASAAEPVQLNDSQMDQVSAGAYSYATGGAGALIGTAVSASSSGTQVKVKPWSYTATTNASSFNLASGFLVGAASEAAAEL